MPRHAITLLVALALLAAPLAADAQPAGRVPRVGVLQQGDLSTPINLRLTEAFRRGLRGPNDFDTAFTAMAKAHAGALTIFPSPMFYAHHQRLVDLAAKHRLPAMYVFREAVEAGGLFQLSAQSLPDVAVMLNSARLLCGGEHGGSGRPEARATSESP